MIAALSWLTEVKIKIKRNHIYVYIWTVYILANIYIHYGKALDEFYPGRDHSDEHLLQCYRPILRSRPPPEKEVFGVSRPPRQRD